MVFCLHDFIETPKQILGSPADILDALVSLLSH